MSVLSIATPSLRKIADAFVSRICGVYLGFARKVTSPGPARSSPAAAVISNEAEIGANVVIGAGCRVAAGVKLHPNVTLYEGVSIGKGSVLHSGVSVRENCKIGRNCIVHNSSTIGSDGFGYAKDAEKRWLKIPQVGRVVLEDDAAIRAG